MPANHREGHTTAVERMPSGIYLPPNAVRTALRIVVDATTLDDDQIGELVDVFARLQLHHPYVKPIFLVSAMEPSELSAAGFMYETVIPESSWRSLKMRAPYRDYVERRVYELIKVYSAHRFGAYTAGMDIPRWFYER